MFPFLGILLLDWISNSSGSTPQRLDKAIYAATMVQVLIVAIVFFLIYACLRMGRVTPNVGVEYDQYSLIDSRPVDASEFTKALVLPPTLIPSTDHIDSFKPSTETCPPSTISLLDSLTSHSHATTPYTHTGIGTQFDSIDIKQEQNTNITTTLEIDEELDLSIIEPLNADALSSLMRKQSEDVWDFMDI